MISHYVLYVIAHLGGKKKRNSKKKKIRKIALIKTPQIAVRPPWEKSLPNMAIFQVPGMLSTRQGCSKPHSACSVQGWACCIHKFSRKLVSVPCHPHSTELLPNI